MRLNRSLSYEATQLRDRDETTASNWVLCWRDCVVPFAVEIVRLDVDLGHFGVGDLKWRFVVVVIEATLGG